MSQSVRLSHQSLMMKSHSHSLTTKTQQTLGLTLDLLLHNLPMSSVGERAMDVCVLAAIGRDLP